MPFYSNMEMADMIFMYGRANGNALKARRLYEAAYPNRALPSCKHFSKSFQRLRDTGSLHKCSADSGRPRTVSTPEVEERILNVIDENSETSVRRISAEVGISGPLVWRTLHSQLLYPYHFQRVQALNRPDCQARMEFCLWVLHQNADNPEFVANILFTDEAGFNKNGIFNFHNNHVWSDENPHARVESHHQVRFSLNIWLGILGDTLIGPVVLPNRLNGAAYHNFLENELPVLLEDVTINQRMNMWFMQDGAPPHYTLQVREHLNHTFPRRWIGRGSFVPWPPRSPDLTPLDFFVWGYLKSLVYAKPVRNLEELQQRIEQSCQTIQRRPGIFDRVRASFLRRCRACVEMEGGHFEHLL